MIVRKIDFSYFECELEKVKVDSLVHNLFKEKSELILFKIYDLDARGANILKQEFLSAGGDVALSRDVASFRVEKSDAILIGTKKVYRKVLEKLAFMPYFGLRDVRVSLEKYLESTPLPIFEIRGRQFDFNSEKLIMGILNVTPDSFSDGGKFLNIDDALKHAEQMVKEGADIIDVGGESTRPYSESVPLDEELRRVIPVIVAIRKEFQTIPISIDTYKSKVAEEAINAGADIINDISGLRFDPLMIDVAKRYNVPVVIMHIKGTPKDMQKNPVYEDLMRELLQYFEERITFLNSVGIDKIVIDPGIGFGKTREHNLEILNKLQEFTIFGKPVLVGLSRKSFIGLTLDNRPVEERLYGTLASNMFALLKGASILRVHDVLPHKDMIRMYKAIVSEGR
ncbi:dihydropteroate synthase [Caldisericum exile]|uniref:Dihydropteroate synthase n=1 Tax=Caldisericum exile (strain DSM 21853 / NBRC 104410 / AZM16c01) TaxID=511051 RepID=A0A7U6GDV8_CALEA|nr:dihydropteroate synthase [Caldisericum exile]BAL80545.1 dihydropteroate synthase [Caldisericum exile AZM16c01]